MRTDREPDLIGRAGRAWRSRVRPEDYAVIEGAASFADKTAGLATWMLKASGFHAAWDEWVIGLVHLRPIEGGTRPPNKQYADAEFELMILSLDPAYNDERDPDVPGLKGYLEPPDLVYQFHGVTDEQAIEIAEMLVRHFVEGTRSPDSDFRRSNTEALDTTVEHYRQGIH